MARSNRRLDRAPELEPGRFFSIDPFAGGPLNLGPERPRALPREYPGRFGAHSRQNALQRVLLWASGRPRARDTRPRGPAARALRSLTAQHPNQVMFCVRRKQRRELLFRFGVAGKRRRSPGRGGSYKRSYSSQWRC